MSFIIPQENGLLFVVAAVFLCIQILLFWRIVSTATLVDQPRVSGAAFAGLFRKVLAPLARIYSVNLGFVALGLWWQWHIGKGLPYALSDDIGLLLIIIFGVPFVFSSLLLNTLSMIQLAMIQRRLLFNLDDLIPTSLTPLSVPLVIVLSIVLTLLAAVAEVGVALPWD